MKQKIIYVASIILSILYLVIGSKVASSNLPVFEHIYQDSCEKAQVQGIIARQSAAQEVGGVQYGRGVNIVFGAKLLTGPQKGAMITALQNCDPDSPYQLREVKTGDHILITQNPDLQGDIKWIMGEYVRTDTLLIFAAAFGLMLIFFGRSKGVNTIFSLMFTCLSIFTVFVPAILSGKNIYFWAILTCAFIIIMTLLIVNGANKKSLCSAIGCFSGILVSGALTLFADHFLQLTGMVDEESLFLKYLIDDYTIDLKAIIFAAILIGAVGAIMDVAISLSSALYEVYEATPDCPPAAIIRSGMTIGRDIMGTMSNTLVLAYIGGSLSLTLLLMAYSSSLLGLLNREMIIVEVLQALVGSFGLLLTIPLTSAVCATIYCFRKKEKDTHVPPVSLDN
ncbi:MAG TPA: YibE/F family protein [Clostridia bacterium]|nr:YibE/F family protein [Clostridia bacterium]